MNVIENKVIDYFIDQMAKLLQLSSSAAVLLRQRSSASELCLSVYIE